MKQIPIRNLKIDSKVRVEVMDNTTKETRFEILRFDWMDWRYWRFIDKDGHMMKASGYLENKWDYYEFVKESLQDSLD